MEINRDASFFVLENCQFNFTDCCKSQGVSAPYTYALIVKLMFISFVSIFGL